MANSTTTFLLLSLLRLIGKPTELKDREGKETKYIVTASDIDFVKKLFHVSRCHPAILDRFEPLNATHYLPGTSKPKFLHGLSRMAILENVNHTAHVNGDQVTIRMRFKYDKLCLTCCPYPNHEIKVWIGSRISPSRHVKASPEVNDLCAQDVNAELIAEKSLNENSRPRVKSLRIKEELFFTNNYNLLRDNNVQLYSKSMQKSINEVISKDVAEYLTKIGQEAGDCYIGNCTDLEDMTDGNFMNLFKNMLEEIEHVKREKDEVTLHDVYEYYVRNNKIKILNSKLIGLTNAKVESFAKSQKRGARSYEMLITVAFKGLCILADVEKDHRIAKELWLCNEDAPALIIIDVLKYPKEPIKTNHVEIIPNFDISGNHYYGFISPSDLKPYIEKIGVSVRLQVKNFFDIVIHNVAGLFSDLVNCNPGNCTSCH